MPGAANGDQARACEDRNVWRSTMHNGAPPPRQPDDRPPGPRAELLVKCSTAPLAPDDKFQA